MKTQALLGALALDLRRAALGYHRGSITMAERFKEEALKRKQEIDQSRVKPYIRILLKKLDLPTRADTKHLAEDYLMYSTLFQNAATAMI